LAHEEFFHGGFCLEFIGMHQRGVQDAISKWQDNVHGFFNLLALEIWGRLFFLRQSVEELTERLMRLSGKAVSSPRIAA
jgi:hypothetical protein